MHTGAANMRWHDADEMRWAVRAWAARIGVKSPEVRLRAMRTKWASMSTAGRMTLDKGLLKQPKRLGEYVLVHELLHLVTPSHGRVFKSFLLAYLPDWEQRDGELRKQAERQRHRIHADCTKGGI